MNGSRSFPLTVVLSVLTGRPVQPATAEAAIQLMEHMTGTSLRVRGGFKFRLIPLASQTCRAALLEHHADLAAAEVPDFTVEAAVAAWVLEMTGRFGPTREIARLGAVPEQRQEAA